MSKPTDMHRAFATEAPLVASHNYVAKRTAGFQQETVRLDDGTSLPYYVYEGPMDTPMVDKRTYKLIRLANDLEALIIHDPEADKASAAMDVRVGHLSDPEGLYGMAHFCEHLLFLLSLIHI